METKEWEEKTIRKAYDKLYKKTSDIQRTNYYKENILNKNSPDN